MKWLSNLFKKDTRSILRASENSNITYGLILNLSSLSKKNIAVIVILFLLSAQLVSAQKVDTLKNKPLRTTYEFHTHRRTVKNVIGWGLLGSSLTMMVIGVEKIYNSPGGSYIFPSDAPNPSIGLFIAGAGTALLSVPFFISAGSSKRKARLSLKTNSIAFGGSGTGNINSMVIALNVHF